MDPINDSPWASQFFQDLLPSAERTALLYHLSYLCLGGFPKLEDLIRGQALETQQLFGSSESLMMKCVVMCSNLDSSLFPILTKVTEKNKPLLILVYLEKVRTWIHDIIRAVGDMVKRYEQHSQSVRICLSAVIQEELNCSRTQPGVIPSPVHLKDVQQCLTRIQQILLQLKLFWERVGDSLYTMKNKTFVGEDLIEDLDDLKEEFLTAIEATRKYWNNFGGCCRSAQGVFSIQSKDAYKFLEINPSSLSEDERKMLYESVMEKLNQITPQYSSTE
ncbi:uncharacterized protein LOC128012985 isoform X2 [Carassius gibelio]|uniref:uncharacterized protein LOC128012985 isoform X2 n=1 Tax=Carassius gibelio TaxID=101364 RepID=UPI0022779F13|nr:uncharacterized protein LOC128012985 isoform X2 [Carassius gibelio]XP_052451607.1 uncharacterized protein LOC128012985 isoform X2 [Carassius gibelio]XP_052451608.1 uncharacterized protein LOC128012985 isoform X2 [Carassius gibelio]